MTFSSKGASEGTLRIYIDKNETPVVEGEMLNILSGNYLAPQTVNYVLTAYRYIKPGFVSSVSPDIKSTKAPVALKCSDVISPVVDKSGKIKGEDPEVISCTCGTYSIQYGYSLSGKLSG